MNGESILNQCFLSYQLKLQRGVFQTDNICMTGMRLLRLRPHFFLREEGNAGHIDNLLLNIYLEEHEA